MKLVIATGNRGKLLEIKGLLDDSHVEAQGLDEFGELPEIIEDGLTFEENALKKARIVSLATGCLALADDSGLVVEALDGAPGVRSARFAGEEAGDDENNRKLLAAMHDLSQEQRRAAFCCAMVLYRPDGWFRVFHGKLAGRIIEAFRGTGGFGYDPLFWVPEYGKTLAELPLSCKNRISHRGQALRQVMECLRNEFQV